MNSLKALLLLEIYNSHAEIITSSQPNCLYINNKIFDSECIDLIYSFYDSQFLNMHENKYSKIFTVNKTGELELSKFFPSSSLKTKETISEF